MKIRRENVLVNANTRVCSVHFAEETIDVKGGSIPTVFLWSRRPRKRSTETSVRAAEAAHDFSDPSSDCPPAKKLDCSPSHSLRSPAPSAPSRPAVLDPETDVETSILHATLESLVNELEVARDRARKLESELEDRNIRLANLTSSEATATFSYATIAKKPHMLKFYTGLDEAAIDFIWELMGDSVHSACRHTTKDADNFSGHGRGGRKRKLCARDELFLTLCKLRHNFPEDDLAQRFNIHQTTVSRIFSSWIETMDACFQEVNLWPERDDVRASLPDVFKEQYATTRALIDCSELFIEKPHNPDTQSQSWSSYKHHNTLKFLLAVTPNGVPSFVSDCYGGRISDKELTHLSGVLSSSRFERGDSVMVDKGFDIDELTEQQGVKLEQPPFLRGKDQLDEDEVVTTRRIASLRIHVERAIERIKNYAILRFLPTSLCPQASRLVRICTFLTSLLPPLVPPAGSAASGTEEALDSDWLEMLVPDDPLEATY